ncbi:MAG: transglycosylase domain-containing protein [Gemmatimonadales bacterium]
MPVTPRRRWVRRVALVSALPTALAVAVTGYVLWPLPPGLLAPDPRAGVRIEDRNGALLRTTRAEDGSRQAWVRLDEMDPDLLAAFVAVEDRRFYQHHGVDPRAVARALRQNLGSGRVVSGASTITMQLARLLFRSDRDRAG